MKRLLLCAALVIFPAIAVLPVCDPSEARYAEISREMAAGGNWLIPHAQGRPHLTKPPLTYWLGALSIRAFGPRAWAARLPVALAFLLTVMITADLGRRLWRNGNGGSWSGWALLSSGLPLAASGIVTSDTILTFFETAAVWCGWRSITAPAPGAGRRWAWGFHAAAGLAFLTKGPPGLLVPAAFALFALVHRRRLPSQRLLSPAGFVALALVTVPWYLAVSLAVPEALQYWWETEILTRNLGDSHRNMHFSLYFPILLAGSLPAALTLPAAARSLWGEIRRAGPDAPGGLLLCWWLGLPLLVFCASRSRLIFYVLPLFPGLALLMGRLALIRSWRPVRTRTALSLAAAAGLLVVGVRLALPHAGVLKPDPRPLAAAITADAAAAGRPARVFFERSKRIPACGVAFYLRSTLEPFDVEDPCELADLLAEACREEAYRYFLVRGDHTAELEAAAGTLTSGRWIVATGPVRVWRQNFNSSSCTPPDRPRSHPGRRPVPAGEAARRPGRAG